MPAFLRTAFTLPFLALCAAAATGAGCTSHSLREGEWILSFNAKDYESNVSVPPELLQEARVELAIDWSTDPDYLEEFVLTSVDETALPEIYGIVFRNGTVLVNAKDPFWVFRLEGKIIDEEHVSGNNFVARYRFDDVTALVGLWDLRYAD